MTSKDFYIKQGYLYKQSLYLKKLRKRWVVLNGSNLICYENSKITEKINLRKFTVIRISKIQNRFELIASNGKTKKKRVFAASDSVEMITWVQHLQSVITANKYNMLPQQRRINSKQSISPLNISQPERSANEFQSNYQSPKHLIDFTDSTKDKNDINMNNLEDVRIEYTRTATTTLDSDRTYDLFENVSDKNNDPFYRLKIILESQLMTVLKEENIEIIFDSLIGIYSKSKQAFIDYAAIMTKNDLYLTSPGNYDIWLEFKSKSKIDELINQENRNEYKQIDDKIAEKLAKNLNINDNNEDLMKIRSSIRGHTKKQIKLNILLNQNKISSLCELFQLDENEGKFSDADIPTVGGSEYLNKIRFTHSELKVIELRRFREIKCINNSACDGFMFILVGSDSIVCRLESNNLRHAWLTHIDFIKNSVHESTECKLKDNGSNDKYMHDFSMNPNNEEQKLYSTDFNFGEYLNFWEDGYPDSVTAKYCTLKQELLKNKIRQISKKNYYWLYKECSKLMQRHGWKHKAQDIGINNEKFNIAVGSAITINHVISLKLYTDFVCLQRAFKRNCRKLNEKEKLSHFVSRNREIHHWCRYLHECCTFYGTKMKKRCVLYTGLKKKLMFSSLKQHFYCPISTTTEPGIAENFCDDNGIILKLKAANTKSRYFNVSFLSHFEHEKERLIINSSMKIVDIFINGKTMKTYISSLAMLEQIIDGQFIDIKPETEQKLYDVLMFILSENASKQHPFYIIALFKNMIQRMQKQNDLNALWINKSALELIQHKQLKQLINGDFFNRFGISNIKWVQQFEWTIDSIECKTCEFEQERFYLKSAQYQYNLDKYNKIGFHLEFCCKYSIKDQKCALFFNLDTLPINIDSIQIEYDVLCDYGGKHKYEEIISPQWINKSKSSCGFKTFPSRFIDNKSAISWFIGIKIVNIKYYDTRSNDININIKDITNELQLNDQGAIFEKFKLLIEQNMQLKLANDEKESKLSDLQNQIDKLKK